jgi:hypothetical protein
MINFYLGSIHTTQRLKNRKAPKGSDFRGSVPVRGVPVRVSQYRFS